MLPAETEAAGESMPLSQELTGLAKLGRPVCAREFDAKDLPEAVTAAVAKQHSKAKMKEVMEITEIKEKKEVHGGFEIVLETGDKKDVEVTVSKDGKILEDSGEKKDKDK